MFILTIVESKCADAIIRSRNCCHWLAVTESTDADISGIRKWVGDSPGSEFSIFHSTQFHFGKQIECASRLALSPSTNESCLHSGCMLHLKNMSTSENMKRLLIPLIMTSSVKNFKFMVFSSESCFGSGHTYPTVNNSAG